MVVSIHACATWVNDAGVETDVHVLLPSLGQGGSLGYDTIRSTYPRILAHDS
jgi:hypothetical protein